MIQELLGGERKISINGVLLESSTSPSPSPSPSSSENQNLRCPRCDSSNTKFCYYNNYNLTQPRYFCKTCRRYWTKGGALRNVPIGGGCRKNKSAAMPTPAAVKSCGGGRLKTVSSDQFPSNPIMWASPQNSHILALLRSTQNPNPDPNPNSILSSVAVKDEPGIMIGTHLGSESGVGPSGLNGRTPGLDPLSQFSSFWRNNFQEQAQQNQQNQLHNGFILGEVQNTNIQELYQRLRSSANYYADHSPQFLSNLNSSSSSSSSSSTSTILDSAPVGGSELGYWNSTLSWSHDLQTANGTAYL